MLEAPHVFLVRDETTKAIDRQRMVSISEINAKNLKDLRLTLLLSRTSKVSLVAAPEHIGLLSSGRLSQM